MAQREGEPLGELLGEPLSEPLSEPLGVPLSLGEGKVGVGLSSPEALTDKVTLRVEETVRLGLSEADTLGLPETEMDRVGL